MSVLTIKDIETIIRYKFLITDGVSMELSYVPLYVEDRYTFELIYTDDIKGVTRKYDIEIYREQSHFEITPTLYCYMVYVKKPHAFSADPYVVNPNNLRSKQYLSHALFTLVYKEYEYNPEYRELL